MGYADGFDAVSRRRQMASTNAPRASWDVPDDWQAPRGGSSAAPAAPASPYGGGEGGSFSGSGDPMFDAVRNTAMADASARTRGLRSAALTASPNDPALAGQASLQGLLVGQGDAARSLNHGALEYMEHEKQRKWQEYIMRLQHEWQQEQQKAAAQAALYQGIGGLGGAALAAI